MYYQFKLNSYTIQDLLILSRVTAKCYRRVRTLISRVVLFFLGLVMLGMGLLVLIGAGPLTLEILLLAGGLLYIGLSIFYHRLVAWKSRRMLIKNTGEITVTLDDAGVRECSEKVEGFYPYQAFIGCVYSPGWYFLFLDKKHAVILPEGAMIAGDPEHFRDFIQEKTGKPVEYVK